MKLIKSVPYFSQNNNESGTGYRECFGSSVAMLLGYYNLVNTDDEYIKFTKKFGDVTSAHTHIEAVKRFGKQPLFRTNTTKKDIVNLITDDIPVAVGWLHKGDIVSPSGFGHWSVIIGYDEYVTVHNDPNGEANLASGGYSENLNGKEIAYSWKNWLPRWEVFGNDGFLFVVT